MISFRKVLWGLIILGTVVRVVLAFTTYGVEFDINNFARVGSVLTESHPLRVYTELNSKTSVVNAETLYGWPYPGGFFPWIVTSIFVEHRTPLPFHGLIQLPSILADVGLALVVQAYLGWRGAPERARLLAAGAVALGPIFIAISGYHGQIDSLAFLPAVLALVIWDGHGQHLISDIPWARLRRWLQAAGSDRHPALNRGLATGLLIGVGAAVKTVPLFMILALLPSTKSRKEAMTVVVAAAAIPLLTLLPFFISDPGGVAGIAGYRGAPGLGGVGLIAQPDLAASWLSPHGAFDFTGVSLFLLNWGPRLLVLLLLLLTLFMVRFRPAPIDATVLLWVATYVFSPTFFFQYLVWGMPFMLMAGYIRAVIALQLVAIVPAVVQYMAPWPNGDIAIPYVAIMIPIWLGFACALFLLLRRTVRGSSNHPDRIQPPLVDAGTLVPVHA
jgi:hypothetical protein